MAAAALGQEVYKNPDAAVEKRVEDVLGRLTLEQKAELMYKDAGAIKALGLRAFEGGGNQVLHGVKAKQVTTMFPIPPGMAATWNPELIQSVAGVIGDETRALHNIGKKGLVVRSPVIDMVRTPLYGRVCETWGEDIHLTTRMGTAFVMGLQGDNPKYLKVASTLKHLGAYDVEEKRTGTWNSVVTERWFNEYYTKAFRDVARGARVSSIMISYNNITLAGGATLPVHANPAVARETIKKRWGWPGFVVADAEGVDHLVETKKFCETREEAAAVAVLAGVDLAERIFAEQLPLAVRNGRLKETDLDESVRRILRVRFLLGDFDAPGLNPYDAIPASSIGAPEHRALSLKTAQESIVLLENKNHFLPLDPAKLKRIAVVGPHADKFYPGTARYSGMAANPVTAFAGVKNRAGAGVTVVHAEGCTIGGGSDASIKEAADLAATADVALVFLGTDDSIETEGRDRDEITLPKRQLQLAQEVFKSNPKTVVVLMNAGALSVRWIKDTIPGVLAAFIPGEEGGNAMADVIFGNVNPSGKLPYTVYEDLAQLPAKNEYDLSKGFTYMYFKGAPQFPFGHGLSYSTFEYAGMKVTPAVATTGTVEISFELKNTGSKAGAEVVQAYVHNKQPTITPAPLKELKAFQKVFLKPGESRTVKLTIPAADLTRYSEALHDFIVDPGDYELTVGSSAADGRLTGGFRVGK
jgi:beta-glucosidase